MISDIIYIFKIYTIVYILPGTYRRNDIRDTYRSLGPTAMAGILYDRIGNIYMLIYMHYVFANTEHSVHK